MPKDTGIVEAITNVREQLRSRGARTVRGISRVFRQMDSFDGNNKIDRDEFAVGLRESGCELSKQELETLFDYFDKNKDGNIDFEEFLQGIRGKPNKRRQALIDKAFLKFDRDGNGVIDMNEIKSVYNASMHPKVQKGEITEEQAIQEFLSNFSDRNGDGKIQREEFNDYYAAVSADIDNDGHFVQLMKMVWRMD